MSYRRVKALLLACSGACALLAATADANAGGFAVREQSSVGQGSSYAGVAAGGSLSSMFWNPATMTQVPGLQSESVLTGIIPYSANTVGAGSTLSAVGLGGTGDTGNDALVPSSYYSWQVNPQTWLGLSINAPFGLSVSFPDGWAGRNYSGDTSLKTYNFTPSVAYKINDMISVGVGVQIQYAKADLATGLPIDANVNFPGLLNVASIEGHGWGYGFTAGVTLTPTPTTTIGLGYRSAINQKINGTFTLPPGALFSPPFSTPGDVSTTINLPDVVSLGLRQKLSPQWTVMATGEWSNWSRIGTSTLFQPNGQPATILAGLGGGAVVLPFQYQDGWFFSLGAEYQWTTNLAVRGGVGFERSPITDDVRTPRLPDNDRTWLSVGASYKYNKKMTFDFAYSHLFVKDTSISIAPGTDNPWYNGLITYNGTVDSHVDIISVAMHYRWDEPAAPAKQGYFKAK
ncbi:MAG: OmpP1/FadL family transporter [Pseudolabrys sp.]